VCVCVRGCVVLEVDSAELVGQIADIDNRYSCVCVCMRTDVSVSVNLRQSVYACVCQLGGMGWLLLVGSLKL